MIMFDVPEPFQSIGIDAYRRTWETFYRYTKLGVFDIQHLTVVAGEDVAFCIATMKCEDNSDGAGFTPLDFRLTIGLKKLADQWTIVHEHHSIPSK
jgi:ketosteroid isomerase-like protein